MNGIVVGVERSPEGIAAVEWAVQEAVLRDQPLLAVRAWSDPIAAGYAMGAALVMSADEAEAQALRVVDEVLAQVTARVPGGDTVDVRREAVRGGVGACLVHAARGASLLVVGTRSANTFSRALLGSVSEHALHHAPCPVAVVPSPHDPSSRPACVVVGVDHSAPSLAALAWAADEAARRDLVLVPVLVRDAVWAPDHRISTQPQTLSYLEASERRSLAQAVPSDHRVRVAPEVVTGPAGKALVAVTEPQDVLVVGSRGRGGAAGRLLGSTSTHVAEHGHCPVVVVREGQAG